MDLSQAFPNLQGDVWGAFSLILLATVGVLVVIWDSFRNDSRAIPVVSNLAILVAIGVEVLRLGSDPGTVFSGMVRTGGFAAYINIVLLAGTFLTIALSGPYLRAIGRNYGEVHALVLFSLVGMILLGTANNLVTVFVGLETMSMCLYVLTGLVREHTGASESSLKYFLLGSFSTGFFLYGIALLYGATGTMSLPEMQAGLTASARYEMFWAGAALLFIGFLFKVSAVPFHMWTPDVYQGAPTTLTGFMSTASKASAFASLTLILYYALPPERWNTVLAVVSVLTMVVGNVLALLQQNVKRMLAYSSIAHAGYILVGIAAGTPEGYSGVMIYLLFYTLMNVGAFGVLAFLEWDEEEGARQTLESLAGVGFRYPVLGVVMGVFMFSLSGFPPMAGFFGKVAVFAPAIDAGLTWLVVVGVLASAVSAGYYLRILWVFWMRTPEQEPDARHAEKTVFQVPGAVTAVLVGCAVLILALGFVPGLYELTMSFFQEGGTAVAVR